MLLAIDIGNTNIILGIFKDEELRATWRIATGIHRMADEYAVFCIKIFSRSMAVFNASLTSLLLNGLLSVSMGIE